MSGLADVNFHGRTRSLLEDADFNQSPAFADVDLAAIDAPLLDAGGGAGVDLKALYAFARDWG